MEVALRAIIDVFRTYEPAAPKLNPNRWKDLLKIFYGSVIDEQLRHDLGEYYTPDWLADYTLDRAGYRGQINATVLDPACGSGTFLVLAIQRLIRTARARHLSSVEIVDRVRNQIKGFDLNPLAVISARANYLLAIAEELSAYGGGIELPVYLCDCINVPRQKAVDEVRCLVYTLDTELGEREIALPEALVASGHAGAALLEAEKCITQGDNSSVFLQRLRSNPATGPLLHQPDLGILRKFFEIIQDFEARIGIKSGAELLRTILPLRRYATSAMSLEILRGCGGVVFLGAIASDANRSVTIMALFRVAGMRAASRATSRPSFSIRLWIIGCACEVNSLS